MQGLNLGPIAALIETLVLLDTVRISEPGPGVPVFNDDTGEYTYPEAATVYEGPGAVQAGGTAGGYTAVPVAGLPWSDETRSKYKLLTPLSAPVAGRDHIVTVTSVHPGGDPALIGRQWRCQDPGQASTLVAVRTTPIDQIQQAQEA